MRTPDRLGVIYGSLLLFALALVGKAGYEQLYRGRYWSTIGRSQHYAPSNLPAHRGQVEDASGSVLAESRVLTRIAIVPRDVRSPAKLAGAMKMAHIDPHWIAEALDKRRRWVEPPDLFLPSDIAPILLLRGVRAIPVMDRVYANSAGIRRIVGRVSPSGTPTDGIELALDEALRGDTGSVRIAQDENGNKLEAPPEAKGSRGGSIVTLTINRNLQDICERSLVDAVDSLHATGGDIVVMNPQNGDILAMASRRSDPRAVANTAVTEPYEPGSTVKPFVAAALLSLGRARPDETIDTYGGHLILDGRKINDAEEHEAIMTLSQVIQHSSNVGIVRFGERLTPREKYELFRDVGFGTPTTVLLPAESPGTLYQPVRWSKTSSASVVMGYEVAVTPLQVVTAYSAIANGGELLEPHIVKAIRSPMGDIQYTERRRVVRRVMSPQVAATIRQMLRDVVSGGTSTKADLQTLDVAGKSGTARKNVHGRYQDAYTASFVGLFPQDNPQFVVLVKLDKPQNGYYGGVVAGSVTNIVLRAALSARDAALDLYQLAASVHAPRPDTSVAARQAARAQSTADSIRSAAQQQQRTVAPVSDDTDPRTSSSYVVVLPSVRHIAPVATSTRLIPDVTGLPLRVAVRVLHTAGFRVQIVPGTVMHTVPDAGTAWMPGRVVRLSAP